MCVVRVRVLLPCHCDGVTAAPSHGTAHDSQIQNLLCKSCCISFFHAVHDVAWLEVIQLLIYAQHSLISEQIALRLFHADIIYVFYVLY